MPKRIVKQPVMVQREGKLVYPMVGQEFDFASNEIEQINKLQPKALGRIVVTDAPKQVETAPAKKAAPLEVKPV